MVIITPEQAAERISPVFKGRKGRFLFNLAARLTGIARINALHYRVDTAGVPYGPPFAHALLADLDIDFRIGCADRLEALPDGVTKLETNGGRLLVSQIVKGKRSFLVLVSTSIDKSVDLDIAFDRQLIITGISCSCRNFKSPYYVCLAVDIYCSFSLSVFCISCDRAKCFS